MTDEISRIDRRRRLIAAFAGAWLALAAAASAHEFWLVPDTFEPEVGVPLGVRAFVGDGFEAGRPYARNPNHINYFEARTPTATAIEGTPGRDPAGHFTPTEPGVVALVYRSHASTLTLAADRFEAYLDKEGLEQVSRLRAAAGESSKAGRESFSRCAKALVLVAGGDTEGFDRPAGLDLEIVPLASPFALEPGAVLPVRVLWKGEPVADAQIRAFVAGRPDLTIELRADADGVAAVEITSGGVWLLSAVHMERADPGSGVDWRSTWSSLTFATGAAAGAER